MGIEKLIHLWLQSPEENPCNFEMTEAFDIEPLDPQKRLRVLDGWLMDAVLEDINIFNHSTRISAYLKQLSNMHRSYPIHENHINDISIRLWMRYKYVYKTELKPAIKAWKRKQIMTDLKTLRVI